MRRLFRIIRNILLLAIAAIVILAGVLAFNTLTHGSRQLQVAAVPRAPVDTQAAATRLGEAIRFRTISSYEKPDQHAEALRGMQAHIENSFPAFHAAAKREFVGRNTACSTHGKARIRRPRRSHCSRIRTWCRSRRAPRRTGSSRPLTASSQTASSGAAAPGTTRAICIPCWKPPKLMAKAGFRPKRTIYFAFGHDEEIGGHRAGRSRSRRCWLRAAFASTS